MRSGLCSAAACLGSCRGEHDGANGRDARWAARGDDARRRRALDTAPAKGGSDMIARVFRMEDWVGRGMWAGNAVYSAALSCGEGRFWGGRPSMRLGLTRTKQRLITLQFSKVHLGSRRSVHLQPQTLARAHPSACTSCAGCSRLRLHTQVTHASETH